MLLFKCETLNEKEATQNMLMLVGPFCRKGLSPKGESGWRAINNAGRFRRILCTQVAASREVPLGKRDLLGQKSGKEVPLEPHTTKPATSPTA